MISRIAWIGFSALCLLSGSLSLLPIEDSLPTLERQGLLFGVSALAALCFRPGRLHAVRQLCFAIAGVGFFGLPIAVVDIARGSVGETTRSALFAAVPVVVILTVVIIENAGGAMRLLIPALLGLGGLLLLLPLQFSSSLHGQAMIGLICATVIVAGLCSVWMYRLLRGTNLATAITIIGAANAIFLLFCAVVRGQLLLDRHAVLSFASLWSLVDALEIGVVVWLLREMPPARFAARYLLIPLVTIVESLILVHPTITSRMAFGTLFLTIGGGMLLFLNDADLDFTLSLR